MRFEPCVLPNLISTTVAVFFGCVHASERAFGLLLLQASLPAWVLSARIHRCCYCCRSLPACAHSLLLQASACVRTFCASSPLLLLLLLQASACVRAFCAHSTLLPLLQRASLPTCVRYCAHSSLLLLYINTTTFKYLRIYILSIILSSHSVLIANSATFLYILGYLQALAFINL